MTWAVYGAYGYTGRLVVERALAAGERPLLLGRDTAALAGLATATGLESRAVALDGRGGLAAALEHVDVLANCAGPFVRTARPVVDSCLDTGTHYLDVTGEVAALDAVLDRAGEAQQAGVALLPGSGFDVVPTDCAAAMVAAELGAVDELAIAFLVGGGPSPGTALTALDGLAGGGRARVAGALADVPRGRRHRAFRFPSGERACAAVPWGDLATAGRTTGAGDVTCYTVVPGAAVEPLLRVALRLPGARRACEQALSRVRGPDGAARASSRAEVVVEGRGPAGSARVALRTPNAYDLTADAVLAVVRRLVAGDVAAGAHTPAAAHGAGFVLRLPGVELVEPARRA